jgi:hypothetical protein
MAEDKKKKFGRVSKGKLSSDAENAAANLLGSKGKPISDRLYTRMISDPKDDDRMTRYDEN